MHNGLAVNAFGERERLDLMPYPHAATVVGVILKVAVLLSYVEGSVAGFAVLRYRLYDIDRFINYSLVYGSLTALLALVYFLIVSELLRTPSSSAPC
jgi:hypothetical protein